jgi:transmembrane sensor
MTESQDPKDRRKAAAQWFAELQADDLAPDTWAAFLAWEKDPQNAAAFREIEAAVGIIDRLPEPRPEAGKPDAARSTWERWRLPAVSLGAAAACLLVVLAMPFLTPAAAPAPEVYRTGIGERRDVALEDGSTGLLNTDTELSVAYTKEARSVRLAHGEALFRVHKSARPFLVDAGGTRTRAVGTEFDVRAETGEVSVTLYEGSVVVTPDTEAMIPPERRPDENRQEALGVRLGPGERVTVMAGEAPARSRIDPEAAKSWRDGIVRFNERNEPVFQYRNPHRRRVTCQGADQRFVSRRQAGGLCGEPFTHFRTSGDP